MPCFKVRLHIGDRPMFQRTVDTTSFDDYNYADFAKSLRAWVPEIDLSSLAWLDEDGATPAINQGNDGDLLDALYNVQINAKGGKLVLDIFAKALENPPPQNNPNVPVVNAEQHHDNQLIAHRQSFDFKHEDVSAQGGTMVNKEIAAVGLAVKLKREPIEIVTIDDDEAYDHALPYPALPDNSDTESHVSAEDLIPHHNDLSDHEDVVDGIGRPDDATIESSQEVSNSSSLVAAIIPKLEDTSVSEAIADTACPVADIMADVNPTVEGSSPHPFSDAEVPEAAAVFAGIVPKLEEPSDFDHTITQAYLATETETKHPAEGEEQRVNDPAAPVEVNPAGPSIGVPLGAKLARSRSKVNKALLAEMRKLASKFPPLKPKSKCRRVKSTLPKKPPAGFRPIADEDDVPEIEVSKKKVRSAIFRVNPEPDVVVPIIPLIEQRKVASQEKKQLTLQQHAKQNDFGFARGLRKRKRGVNEGEGSLAGGVRGANAEIQSSSRSAELTAEQQLLVDTVADASGILKIGARVFARGYYTDPNYYAGVIQSYKPYDLTFQYKYEVVFADKSGVRDVSSAGIILLNQLSADRTVSVMKTEEEDEYFVEYLVVKSPNQSDAADWNKGLFELRNKATGHSFSALWSDLVIESVNLDEYISAQNPEFNAYVSGSCITVADGRPKSLRASRIKDLAALRMLENASLQVKISGKHAPTSKSKSKKKKGAKRYEDECYRCGKEGYLILCGRKGCPKGYHLDCLKDDNTRGHFDCPWHFCNDCEKPTKAITLCSQCDSSFCVEHAKGNMALGSDNLFVCKLHDEFASAREDVSAPFDPTKPSCTFVVSGSSTG